MADVAVSSDSSRFLEQFKRSEWFTRGWTLQELLAPAEDIVFCNNDWQLLGDIWSPKIQEAITEVTGIEIEYLTDSDIVRGASAAKKISWLSGRTTTREEDMAYCLLGLLDINLPLLYGEGGTKAFLRLQKEFIEQSQDESIFAWTQEEPGTASALLAEHPRDFKRSSDIILTPGTSPQYIVRPPWTITNKGLQLEATLTRLIRVIPSELQRGHTPEVHKLDDEYHDENSMNQVYIYHRMALNCHRITRFQTGDTMTTPVFLWLVSTRSGEGKPELTARYWPPFPSEHYSVQNPRRRQLTIPLIKKQYANEGDGMFYGNLARRARDE